MTRFGTRSGDRRGLFSGAVLLAVPSLVLGLSSISLLGQEPPPIDPNKMSDLGNMKFDTKTIDFDKQSDLAKTAPGFDKEFKLNGAGSDWINKTANIGGRNIYAPKVDFDKTYPTSDSPLFKETSPFSTKTSSLLTDKKSPFSAEAKAPGLDHIMDDKLYQGREASLVREAMDNLDQKSRDALSKQMTSTSDAAAKSPDAPKTPTVNGGPVSVTPMISIEDVKLLIDKDVVPASDMPQEAAAQTSAAAKPAPTATAKP